MIIDKKEKKEIIDFLRSVSIMSLSVSRKNEPMTSILLFDVDDNFNFYFATVKTTRKAKALAENNKVGLCVWDYEKLMIQVQGLAYQVKDAQKIEKIMDRLIVSLSKINQQFWPPVLKLSNDNDYVIFRIKSNLLRVIDLKNKNIHTPSNSSPIKEFKIK